MEYVIKLLTVFGIATVELWAAIPIGFVMKLHPVATCLASSLGAIAGAFVVLLIGDRIRNWLLKDRKEKDIEKVKYKRIYQIWEKYGVIGLGLLAPLITGPLLGVAVGLSLKANSKSLILWISIGIFVWCVLLTVFGVIGLAGIKALF